MSHVTDNKISQGMCWKFEGKICKLWTPFHKFGTGIPRSFKFSTHIDLSMARLTGDKLPHRGCGGVCLCTKFDVSSFTLYKIKDGVQNLKNSTQIPTTPLPGYFVIHEMENTKIDPYTKFETGKASFTRFKFREGVPKFKILAPDSHDFTLRVFCHP